MRVMKMLTSLQKIQRKQEKYFFNSFQIIFLKANADKCHLILSTDETFSINLDIEIIKNKNNKKLLGKNLNNRLGFDTHMANICNRVSKKLHALARISQYVNIHKRRMKMKAFIASKCGYYPLVSTFYIKELNNQVNKLHERVFRIAYERYVFSFIEVCRSLYLDKVPV